MGRRTDLAPGAEDSLIGDQTVFKVEDALGIFLVAESEAPGHDVAAYVPPDRQR